METPKGRVHLKSESRTPAKSLLEKIRKAVQEFSRPDFRITAYEVKASGKKRIKIEIRGTRTHNANSWKKTKLCDTQMQAAEYIKEEKTHYKEGERKKIAIRLS